MRKGKAARGFILIYVVALVAGISLILLQLNQKRSAIPRQTERIVNHALQSEEGYLLLQFVAAELSGRELPIDPRYQLFKQLLADDPTRASELEERLQQLKAMLEQVGFKIDLTDRNAGTKSGKGEKTAGRSFSTGKDPVTINIGAQTYSVRIIPGNARPNLNSIAFDEFWPLLRHLGIPEDEAKDLAANIIDWRDNDDFLTERRGAEFDYYVRLTPPYRPRNAPIRTWQELSYVKGVSRERLHLLREHFMLGDAGSRGALVDYLTREEIGVMCNLHSETVLAFLHAYEKLGPQEVSAAVIRQTPSPIDTECFERNISWSEDRSRVRIEVSGSESVIHADYEIKAGWYFGQW